MRTRKRSIAWLMWLVFLFAIWLTLARREPAGRLLARSFFSLVTAFLVAMWVWFVVVPKYSLKLARGSLDGQRRLLGWIVKTPGIPRLQVFARYLLAVNDEVCNHYADAEPLFRLILKDNRGSLDAGFESTLRQHLADVLEALGNRDEAEAERERAGEVLLRAKQTVLCHQAQGKLLDRQHRYDEAVTAYEHALSLAPSRSKAIRATLMMQLVMSSNNAGRPADAIRWAEAVLKLDPDGTHGDTARRMAALAYGAMGQLDDAERHIRITAERATSPKKRAEDLVQAASYALRRGDLDEAERISREAEALLPGKQQLPWAVIGQVEKARGRLKEAIEAIEHSVEVPVSHILAKDRFASALIKTELAILHAELGRGETALALIHEAQTELAGDPKHRIKLDASAALVHSFRDERDLALARIASACEGCQNYLEDRATQLNALVLLVRAALLIDEPERAESFLNDLLKFKPDSLNYPFAYFQLAECRRRRGDEAGGREFDTKAASTHFGTRWERLARERLAAQRPS